MAGSILQTAHTNYVHASLATHPLSLTIPSTTAGSLLVVGVFCSAGNNSIISTPTNWTTVAALMQWAGAQSMQLFKFENCTAGLTSVAVNVTFQGGVSDSLGAAMHYVEIGGALTSSTVDQETQTNDGTASALTWTVTTSATTSANDMVIGYFGTANFTNSSGFVFGVTTFDGTVARDGTTGTRAATAMMGYRLVAATGTQAGTFSGGGGTNNLIHVGGAMAAFKVTAAIVTSTRAIPQTLALLQAGKQRAIPQTLALTTTTTRAIPQTLALKQLSLTHAIPQTLALKQASLTRAIPQTLALKTVGLLRAIPQTLALKTTATRVIPQALALKTTSTRVIPQTLAVSTTATHAIPQTLALKTTTTRTIPQTLTLAAVVTRTIPQTLALITTTTRTIPQTLALKATSARAIPQTLALTATSTRVIPQTLAIEQQNLLRAIPQTLHLVVPAPLIVPPLYATLASSNLTSALVESVNYFAVAVESLVRSAEPRDNGSTFAEETDDNATSVLIGE
jgi:hypothetical protein